MCSMITYEEKGFILKKFKKSLYIYIYIYIYILLLLLVVVRDVKYFYIFRYIFF